MEQVSQFCREQYEYVVSSRSVLFQYCQNISPEHFQAQLPSFGRGGTIKSLLVHIANTYQFWIGEVALGKSMQYPHIDTAYHFGEVKNIFASVDVLLENFISSIASGSLQQISYTLNKQAGTASPFKLFTHVITHEYHHKGQILTLSRHLGYIPVDTDIMR